MFKKLTDFLSGSLGVASFLVAWTIRIFFTFLPLYVLDLNFFIDLILIAVVTAGGLFGNVVYGGLWVWAFFSALGQPLDFVIIIFYIVLALHVLNFAQAVIRTIFSR